MKKWRCTVCNYIHTGDEPPEKCPVCGADRSKFVEISEEEAKNFESRKTGKPGQSEPKSPSQETRPREAEKTAPPHPRNNPKTLMDLIDDQLLKHHIHPVLVHAPNGIIPVVVIFMFIAAVFSSPAFSQAASYFLVVVLLLLPAVLYTGYNEWQRKYRGAMTKRFINKLISAGVTTLSCLLVVVWYLIDPDVIFAGAAWRGGFLFLNLVMLGATTAAGYIGGKFVFRD